MGVLAHNHEGKRKYTEALDLVATWRSADGVDWFALYKADDGYEYRGSSFRGTHAEIEAFDARHAQTDDEAIDIIQSEIAAGGYRSGNTSLPMRLELTGLEERRTRLKEIASHQGRMRDILALAYRIDHEWDSGISNPEWDNSYVDPPLIIGDYCALSLEEQGIVLDRLRPEARHFFMIDLENRGLLEVAVSGSSGMSAQRDFPGYRDAPSSTVEGALEQFELGVSIQAITRELRESGLSEAETRRTVNRVTGSMIKRCDSCELHFHPKLVFCPTCGSRLSLLEELLDA